MQVQKSSGFDERQILIGMITRKEVLGQIAVRWESGKGKGLFGNVWSNLIAEWCIDYYQMYQEAPNKHIESLFHSWADESQDKETIKLVETYLESLSGEYDNLKKTINPKYVIDCSSDYFNKVKLQRLKTNLEACLDLKDVKKALKLIDNFNPIDIGLGSGIDLFHDQNEIDSVLSHKWESLIDFPGALGEFFGSALSRDNFVAITAPEKRGKTFMLMELAIRAVLQGRKVMFFEVGDLSQRQIHKRFYTRITKKPTKPQNYKMPISIFRQMDAPYAEVIHTTKICKNEITKEKIVKALDKINNNLKGKLLQTFIFPSMTISVNGIKEIITSQQRRGWSPDVVVIDYADILAPVSGNLESRHQINETWARLRGLSESIHGLVITATQADAKSYKSELLSMDNFSDDKRKNAHVTGMLGLNQNQAEKEKDVMRINWINLREEESSPNKVVHVAGCRAIANPLIKSCW